MDLYGNSRVVHCKSCHCAMPGGMFDLCSDCALDTLKNHRVRPFPAEWAASHIEGVAAN